MDKLMNAANASGRNSKLKDGEYVFYILRRQEKPESYTLLFIGESPSDESVMTFTIDMFEDFSRKKWYNRLGGEPRDEYKLRFMLRELFDYEEPGYCAIANNKIYTNNLYKTENTTRKTIMMISPTPEVITEDMMRYKLPKWSNPNDMGSANWFMNKYISKPSLCNSVDAVLFNNTIVDIIWYQAKEPKLNLLDIIEDAVESKGWTSAGLSCIIIEAHARNLSKFI